MPALDPVGMIAGMMGVPRVIAWGVHFIIGAVIWGGAFAAGAAPARQGLLSEGRRLWRRRLAHHDGSDDAMPGAGFFGMQLGMMAPIMTLLMHLVFGAVLGAACGMLLHRGTLNAICGAATCHDLVSTIGPAVAEPRLRGG